VASKNAWKENNVKQENKHFVTEPRIEALKKALLEVNELVDELYELVYLQHQIWIDSGTGGVRTEYTAELHKRAEAVLSSSPKIHSMNAKHRERSWRSDTTWALYKTTKTKATKKRKGTSSRTYRK
jgi:hypothetical protein